MSPNTPETEGIPTGNVVDSTAGLAAAEGETNRDKVKLTPEQERTALFLPVNNFSRAKRVAKAIFGPTARVWHNNPLRADCERPEVNIYVGLEEPANPGQPFYMGFGSSFQEAMLSALPPDITNDDIVMLAGPELRALHSLDDRVEKDPVRMKFQTLYKGPYPVSFDI